MSEHLLLIQYVINRRSESSTGLRVWTNGLVQKLASDNPLPSPSDLLERDRDLTWEDEKHLSVEQIEAIKTTIRENKFFDLEARLLINYCKEDPGAMIWTVNLDGQQWRVVVFDPRPRRSPQLDNLSKALAEIVAS